MDTINVAASWTDRARRVVVRRINTVARMEGNTLAARNMSTWRALRADRNALERTLDRLDARRCRQRGASS
jgi:hypothetical protein